MKTFFSLALGLWLIFLSAEAQVSYPEFQASLQQEYLERLDTPALLSLPATERRQRILGEFELIQRDWARSVQSWGQPHHQVAVGANALNSWLTHGLADFLAQDLSTLLELIGASYLALARAEQGGLLAPLSPVLIQIGEASKDLQLPSDLSPTQEPMIIRLPLIPSKQVSFWAQQWRRHRQQGKDFPRYLLERYLVPQLLASTDLTAAFSLEREIDQLMRQFRLQERVTVRTENFSSASQLQQRSLLSVLKATLFNINSTPALSEHSIVVDVQPTHQWNSQWRFFAPGRLSTFPPKASVFLIKFNDLNLTPLLSLPALLGDAWDFKPKTTLLAPPRYVGGL